MAHRSSAAAAILNERIASSWLNPYRSWIPWLNQRWASSGLAEMGSGVGTVIIAEVVTVREYPENPG